MVPCFHGSDNLKNVDIFFRISLVNDSILLGWLKNSPALMSIFQLL